MPIHNRKTKKCNTRRNRHIIAGARPSIAELKNHSARLRSVMLSKPEDSNIINDVLTISPYAHIRSKYLLESFVYYILDIHKNNHFIENCLLNVVRRTISENDSNILNESIAVNTILKLLQYDNQFNEAIIELLWSIKPINNVNLLNNLYLSVFFRLNIEVLEAMRDAGHVPLTINHMKHIINIYEKCLSQFPYYYQNKAALQIQRIRDILTTMKPVPESTTANLIYMLKRSNNSVQPDDVEEFYSHIYALAEETDR